MGSSDSRKIADLKTALEVEDGGMMNASLLQQGEGIEKEEPKAWEGWWNEQVVCISGHDFVDIADRKKSALVRLSMDQTDALTVLLTGRAENNFADLIKRIIASKKLSFDMICLKPETGPNGQAVQIDHELSSKCCSKTSLIPISEAN